MDRTNLINSNALHPRYNKKRKNPSNKNKIMTNKKRSKKKIRKINRNKKLWLSLLNKWILLQRKLVKCKPSSNRWRHQKNNYSLYEQNHRFIKNKIVSSGIIWPLFKKSMKISRKGKHPSKEWNRLSDICKKWSINPVKMNRGQENNKLSIGSFWSIRNKWQVDLKFKLRISEECLVSIFYSSKKFPGLIISAYNWDKREINIL